jgi:hypothetical protein
MTALVFDAASAHFLYFGLTRDFFKTRINGKTLQFKTLLGADYSIASIILQFVKARGRVLFIYPLSLFAFIYISLGLFACAYK